MTELTLVSDTPKPITVSIEMWHLSQDDKVIKHLIKWIVINCTHMNFEMRIPEEHDPSELDALKLKVLESIKSVLTQDPKLSIFTADEISTKITWKLDVVRPTSISLPN